MPNFDSEIIYHGVCMACGDTWQEYGAIVICPECGSTDVHDDFGPVEEMDKS